ncbi:MAG: 4'-phosphopantetheinyl transferase superfamily protein, partial [Clostridia bacterium]|nr:4'-phosphopantetheinyl transferase superfamily protein [Clostridia bacterium]
DMLARTMLAEAAKIAPEEIAFTYGEKGKPRANLPLHFNVSHAGAYVLCAVANTPIGADIEQIKPFRAGMVARYFTAAEAAYIWGNNPPLDGNVTDADTCARFYRVWTAKEAYVKMTGTGISTDLTQIRYDHDAQTVCGVGLITPDAPEGYVISILKSDLA